MQHKILIVDDEPDVVALLRDYFEINGYLVFTAITAEEAIQQVEHQPELILLDINMPGMDGIAVCSKIRPFISCPILFLTARVEDADKITAFAAGGDDYVTKPFSIDELGARVAAHLRREARGMQSAQIRFADDLTIDYTAHEAFFCGRRVNLTKKEFEILEFLSRHQGQIFDKERIYEHLWGYDSEGSSTVVAEHIKRIRAKLTAMGAQSPIETVWGVGYKWIK